MRTGIGDEAGKIVCALAFRAQKSALCMFARCEAYLSPPDNIHCGWGFIQSGQPPFGGLGPARCSRTQQRAKTLRAPWGYPQHARVYRVHSAKKVRTKTAAPADAGRSKTAERKHRQGNVASSLHVENCRRPRAATRTQDVGMHDWDRHCALRTTRHSPRAPDELRGHLAVVTLPLTPHTAAAVRPDPDGPPSAARNDPRSRTFRAASPSPQRRRG